MIKKIVRFYIEGFREMTLGKTLWKIILIKLILLFVVIKWLFFPSVLSHYKGDEAKADKVTQELVKPIQP